MHQTICNTIYIYKIIAFGELLEKHAIMSWKCIFLEIAGKLISIAYMYGEILLRKNENYLARFIPFFETQIGLDLNAEDLLTEIVRDNR